MNILYIVKRFPVFSETFITSEIRAIVDLGHRVMVGYFHWEGDPIHEADQWILQNLETFHIPKPGTRWALAQSLLYDVFFLGNTRSVKCLLTKNPRWPYAFMIPLSVRLRGRKIDHVHLHFADRHALLGAAFADLLGIGYSVILHGYDIRDLPLGRDGVVDLIERSKAAFTVSDDNRKRLKELGARQEKLGILSCGIETQHFSAMAPAYEGGRLELVCVARLHPIKAQETIIEAVALLEGRFDIRLTLVGGGTQQEYLEKLAQDFGITHRVIFLGPQDSGQVRKQLFKSHMHILASKHEGLGMATVEAMAAGLIVVGSRVGGIPEVIREGETGFLFEAGDAQDLAGIIYRFQSAPRKYDHLRLKAKEFAISNYDERKRCERLLKKIING